MTGVYSFRPGPSYRGATRQELFDAAMAEPLSMTSTFFDQAKGGILESFGLGTVLRDNLLPSEAPTEPGLVLRTEDGQRVDLPDTPAMRRRRAAFGDLAGDIRPETPQEFQGRRDEAGALTEDQYKASPSFRQNIPWDAGMTQARAEALAAMDDAKRVREFYAEKRPISAFLGSLTGQALDPINYVPVAGPLVKAAAVARFGKIGGAALHSALDAAGNTALFGIGTAGERAKFGDDVSWQATVSQIATAALIGGAFGTVAGAIGKRVDARAVREADQRLATMKTTQEARIALNEGIDALVRGEDVNLSPNATEPMARVAREVAQLSRAYDEVRANPTGNARDPLVHITPDEIEGTIVARGAFKDINEVEFSKRGWGLVKVIWGHGVEARPSRVSPEMQIRKEDITSLPNVVREFEPSSVSSDGLRREWRVTRADGKTVVYADTTMGEKGRHLVTAYVDEPKPGSTSPALSKKRAAPLPESAPQAGDLVEDTAGDRSIGAPEVGQKMPATRNVEQNAVIDKTTARPEPLPEGRAQAETRIAKSDDGKAMADQYRVDPQTGAFAEEGEIAQLQAEGRLTEEDAATLAAAQADFETGAAYAEALKSVAGCLI